MITNAPKSIPRKRRASTAADAADAIAARTGAQPPLTTVAARTSEQTSEGPTGEVIEFIALHKIHRHPLNRAIDPADPKTQALAESICERGQLEPLRVRLIPSERDQYQLISGERRYTALKLLNRLTARCIVVDVDPATALVEVAAANSHREDLDPIQRAHLMQQLMKPIHQGGSGMTLLEAGAVFGLRSESGAKNAMRLLKLPDALKALLISGELPERLLRQLIPYTVAGPVIDAIAADLTSEHEWERSEAITSLMSCAGQPPFISDAIRRHARPVSDDVKHWHGYPVGEHPCLFDWQKHESKLQIVELPTEVEVANRNPKRERGIELQPRKFALNTKLWDKLQEPLAKKAAEEGRKKKSVDARASVQSGKGDSPKKLSPKEQAAIDKQRAEKADKQLNQFTVDWLGRLMRCNLSSQWHQHELICLTLPYVVAQCPSHDLHYAHQNALIECKSLGKETSNYRQNLLPSLASVGSSGRTALDIHGHFWRVLLWPVSQLIDKPKRSTLVAAGTLPDKLVPMGTSSVLELAAIANLTTETAWRAGATDASDERRLISVWLCRHTRDQLRKLMKELDIPYCISSGRNELAGRVLSAHRPGRPLPLPKRLQKVAK